MTLQVLSPHVLTTLVSISSRGMEESRSSSAAFVSTPMENVGMTGGSPSVPVAFVPTFQSQAPLRSRPWIVDPSPRTILRSSSTSEDSEDESLVSADPVVPAEKSLAHALGVAELSFDDLPRKQPWVVGHRGSLYDELENTRSGFQWCAKMGCQAVELDVFVLKCGTVVVFHGGGSDEHPGELIDYCGVEGLITDLTYEEALKLSFNPNFAEFACPLSSLEQGRIPTLEEVLRDAKASGLHIKIELKKDDTVEPTLAVVESMNMMDQCSYSCFNHATLKRLRQLRPNRQLYPTGALFNNVPENYLEIARDCGATEIHLRYDTCTKARVEEIHAAGFGSMLWMRGPRGMIEDTTEKFWDVGNEDESIYATLLKTGVERLCVNRPQILLDVIEKLNYQQEAM